MVRVILIISILCFAFESKSQERIPLYYGKIPNSKKTENKEQDLPNALVDTITLNVSEPSLTIFLPEKEKRNGTAIIICPGGGYGSLLTKREGAEAAKAFNKLGITAFVLRYRLPNDQILVDRSIGPLQDVQQAMRIVRENANKWNIQKDKIGVMGYSAGGHLAASIGVHYNDVKINNPHVIQLRPDFLILVNPVISFTDSIGHIGSRNNLLGENPSPEMIKYFSNELHVDSLTPPTFLVHSGNDVVVPVKNSLYFYNRLLDHKVKAAMHIYAFGEHGFLTSPSFEEWFGRCTYWLKSMSLIQ